MVDQIWEGHLAAMSRFKINLSKCSDKDKFFINALTVMAFIEAGIEVKGPVTSEDMELIRNHMCVHLSKNKDIYPPGETPA